MGNTLTGSGSPESGPPSLSTRDEVTGEGNRLMTRTQNTSSKNMHSAPTLLLNVHELAPPSPRRAGLQLCQSNLSSTCWRCRARW